jgi:hypothetical protein
MFGTWSEKGWRMHCGRKRRDREAADGDRRMATMKEAAHYPKMANQKRLAASAMPLLSLDQTANNSLPLLGQVEESGSKRGKKPRIFKA